MSENLVPIISIDDKTDSSKSGGSSSGKTAGIAVGVVVGVLALATAIGAFFFFRYKRNKRDKDAKGSSDGSNPGQNLIDQGFDDKGELDTDHERH